MKNNEYIVSYRVELAACADFFSFTMDSRVAKGRKMKANVTKTAAPAPRRAVWQLNSGDGMLLYILEVIQGYFHASRVRISQKSYQIP